MLSIHFKPTMYSLNDPITVQVIYAKVESYCGIGEAMEQVCLGYRVGRA